MSSAISSSKRSGWWLFQASTQRLAKSLANPTSRADGAGGLAVMKTPLSPRATLLRRYPPLKRRFAGFAGANPAAIAGAQVCSTDQRPDNSAEGTGWSSGAWLNRLPQAGPTKAMEQVADISAHENQLRLLRTTV